ncbi:hypothetical protein [Actinomyces succiniciruminis]|uniref:PLC-like phosphodiesterase, TIM beta/alpha-barrel domain n=1 Tax=Actinomyces succiniciruminis TaxID=1522002 RepID=A0A1L7RLJ1_9ACTO|nr:hypothetical protein [Actinomyces succiniciruminis]CED90134.1 PLC-like phosphodiesterase, TIM beta/alpha-barrel domain [Actinomyces succiniciruminis]
MTTADPAEFISDLPDDTPLCALTIPGTHDTMTSACTHPYYRTQDLGLAEQIGCGVRYLDLRLRRSMVAAHREWISDISAESILQTLREHLTAHPRDFFLARIQNANEAKDDFEAYGNALTALIAKNRDLFWTPEQAGGGTVWPALGSIRGKVVAFECAPAQFGLTAVGDRPWAVPWHDNRRILLQDDWDGPEPAAKLSRIERLYTHRGDDDCLLLNHVSATNGRLGTPIAYAQRTNPQVLRLLRQAHGRGVLIFDFVDSELVDAAWGVSALRS